MAEVSVTEPRARWARFTAIVIGVSLALSLPALLAGYWGDDYFFASELVRPDNPFGYYDFGDGLHQRGLAPW